MRARNILLVDDSEDFRSSVHKMLGRAFFITDAASEAEFRGLFRPYTFDLIILDMRLETGREGLRLLREILAYDELQPVIMVSAYGDTDAVLDSAEAGALMFLHKQEFTPELLARMVEAVLQQARVRRHLAALQGRIPDGDPLALFGQNPAVKRVAEQVRRATDDPESLVLAIGERGTGPALVAQAIHDQSRMRATAPLIVAAGVSRTDEDLENTLFGVVVNKGMPRRKGLFEQANGGVLFLDGMADLAPELRARIGDALSKRRLDACNPPIPLDLQFVAGALPEAAVEVADSLRRKGVAERLIEIYLPLLRDRREDIPLLATSYLQTTRRNGETPARTISRDALGLLETYSWPGNLVELRSVVEYAAIQATIGGSEELAAEHLPANLRHHGDNEPGADNWDYRYHVARAEVALVERALKDRSPLNNTQLAELLGYKDRFAIGRRMRKALTGLEGLVSEFPETTRRFTQKTKPT